MSGGNRAGEPKAPPREVLQQPAAREEAPEQEKERLAQVKVLDWLESRLW